MRVLVTGANGFIGVALCRELIARGYQVRRAVRNVPPEANAINTVAVGEVDHTTVWHPAFEDIEVIVHLVGYTHRASTDPDQLDVFRKVNVVGTEHLAREAPAAGVRRLVYLSSVKVNGEETTVSPFTEAQASDPEDPYGVSKREAEEVLFRVSSETGLEVSVIRPPLVYGPGVKGNFRRLLEWIDRGLPVPVPVVGNRRSLVSVENLVALIIKCMEHPRAAGEVFLVADGEDVSTTDLVRKLAGALGRPARVLPLPSRLARSVARLAGKEETVRRLFGSLQVDCNKAQALLGWGPTESLDQGIARTAAWFRSVRSGRSATVSGM